MQESENSPDPVALTEGHEIAAPSVESREQRIADYVAESLAKDDALEANLGILNADLMLIAHRFRHALDEALQQPPETLAEMAEFMPGIDGYLRVVKQIDRFSQLALKLQGTNAKS
jgi:hypothetical protein